jgi:hypothetical protein
MKNRSRSEEIRERFWGNSKSTDFEQRFVQRRPILLGAFFLDLTQLDVGNLVMIDDMFPGFGYAHHVLILSIDKGAKDLLTLLQGESLGSHGYRSFPAAIGEVYGP